MSVINDVLIAVINMAQATNPYAQITVGALPADNSICCAISSGYPEATFNDKGFSYDLSLVLNGKHANQQIVSDALNNIHRALTQTKTYPQTATYQINNIETTASPSYIGREENKQHLYGSSLQVRFYYRAGDAPLPPGPDVYPGPYTAIPAVVEQVLATENKFMEDDVTVTEIPYAETGNEYGTTVVIAS